MAISAMTSLFMHKVHRNIQYFITLIVLFHDKRKSREMKRPKAGLVPFSNEKLQVC